MSRLVLDTNCLVQIVSLEDHPFPKGGGCWIDGVYGNTGLTQFVPDIPNWVIMPMARMAQLLGSPMGICPARVKTLTSDKDRGMFFDKTCEI